MYKQDVTMSFVALHANEQKRTYFIIFTANINAVHDTMQVLETQNWKKCTKWNSTEVP